MRKGGIFMQKGKVMKSAAMLAAAVLLVFGTVSAENAAAAEESVPTDADVWLTKAASFGCGIP